MGSGCGLGGLAEQGRQVPWVGAGVSCGEFQGMQVGHARQAPLPLVAAEVPQHAVAGGQ